jgi:hypothetical protein
MDTSSVLAALGFSDYAIIAWIVLVCAGGAVYTTRQRISLRSLERKVDALLKHQGIIIPPIVSEEGQRILNDQATKASARKTEAIRLHREQTGLDREDATADVEAFIAGKQ